MSSTNKSKKRMGALTFIIFDLVFPKVSTGRFPVFIFFSTIKTKRAGMMKYLKKKARIQEIKTEYKKCKCFCNKEKRSNGKWYIISNEVKPHWLDSSTSRSKSCH